METEYQRLNSFNRETLLSGGSSSIVGSLGQSGGDEPEGICLPQVVETSVQGDLHTQEMSQTIHQTTSEREAKDPLITDKAEQSSYNKEQIEKIDENMQDWFSNTGVTAVLITFFQGHIRILAPDHMSPLKGNQDFKQIFLTTLFKNVPATKGKEKLNNVIEEGNEIIENRIVTCEKCGRAFKSENQLRGHRLLVHMSTESPNHKCEKCGKTFQAAAFLQTHLCNRTGRRDHECKVCGTRFTTEGSLKIHSRIHTDEKPFKCPTCGQSFPRRSSLNYHIAKHTGEKQYKCSTCDKQFVLLNNLRDHERIHSGERPFSCQECGKSFTVSSTLRRHLLVHSGEKPYQCDKCNGRFTRLVHLQSHMRIHSGERPYKCDGCDKSFAQSSHLRRHQKIHDRERTRTCDKCGKELSGDQLENGIQHSCTPVPEQNFRQLNFQFCAFDKQFGQV